MEIEVPALGSTPCRDIRDTMDLLIKFECKGEEYTGKTGEDLGARLVARTLFQAM